MDFFIKEIALESDRNGLSSQSCVRVQLWDIAGQDRSKKVNRVSQKIMLHFPPADLLTQLSPVVPSLRHGHRAESRGESYDCACIHLDVIVA